MTCSVQAQPGYHSVLGGCYLSGPRFIPSDNGSFEIVPTSHAMRLYALAHADRIHELRQADFATGLTDTFDLLAGRELLVLLQSNK